MDHVSDQMNDDPRDVLARRLDDGFDRIEQATMRGQDVAAWEGFWFGLLHEYEAICERMGSDHQAEAA